MKERLENYLRRNAKKMYNKCSKLVDDQLKAVREHIEAKKDDIIEDITQEIRRDYMNVMMDVQIEKLSRAERRMRKALYTQIKGAGKLFATLATTNTIDLLDDEEKNIKAEAAAKEEIRAREEQDAEVVLAEEWVDQASPEELAAASQAAEDEKADIPPPNTADTPTEMGASPQPKTEAKSTPEITEKDESDDEESNADEDDDAAE
jgi:hypothetical protein